MGHPPEAFWLSAPLVILDALEIFTWPSSTSLLICICRLVGLWSSAKMLVTGRLDTNQPQAD